LVNRDLDTDGAEFIDTHLVDRLLNEGLDLAVLIICQVVVIRI
jgi:hypothetical protein